MPAPILLERRNALAMRLYGVAFTSMAAAAGALLLLRAEGEGTVALGVGSLLLALLVARGSLRVADRVELDGARARVRTLWLGRTRELELSQLAQVQVRPQVVRGSATSLEPATFSLALADGEHLFLSAVGFPGADRLVERAMQAPAEGFGFPVRLASACLVAWVRYLEDPRLGCSASYALEGGGTLSLFAYRGDAASVPDGPESEVLTAELEKACGDVRKLSAPAGAAVRELERGLFGAGGPLPMRTARFELGGTTSCVYLTGHGGRFLKGRFTGSAAAEARVAESLGALAERLRDVTRAA